MPQGDHRDSFWKRHPILEKVVGGLVLAALISLIVYLIPNGWPQVFKFVKAVPSGMKQLLTHPVSAQLWVWMLLAVAFMVILAIALQIARTWLRNRLLALQLEIIQTNISDRQATPRAGNSRKDSIFNYTSDEIFGVNWIWNYYSSKINESSLGARWWWSKKRNLLLPINALKLRKCAQYDTINSSAAFMNFTKAKITDLSRPNPWSAKRIYLMT
jgi:hypothetical protein